MLQKPGLLLALKKFWNWTILGFQGCGVPIVIPEKNKKQKTNKKKPNSWALLCKDNLEQGSDWAGRGSS
jgi:hypothetical protein